MISIYNWLCFRSEKYQQMDPTSPQNQALRRYRKALWGRWSTPFCAQVMFLSLSSMMVRNWGSNSIHVIPTSSRTPHRISGQTGGHLLPRRGSTAGQDHLYMDLQIAAPLSLERPTRLFHRQQRLDLSMRAAILYNLYANKRPNTKFFNLICVQGLHCPASPTPTAQQHWASSRLHPHPGDPRGWRRPNTNSVKSHCLLSARPLLRAPAALPSPSGRRMAWLLCSNAASPGKSFSDTDSPASRCYFYSPPTSY